jgi:hypothetical protein
VFNHDPENLKQGQKAYYEIVDQVGCITNVPLQLVHYFWEPKAFAYPTSSSNASAGIMNFIQNNTIVYQAPKEEYVSYDFIKDMVPTGIEEQQAYPHLLPQGKGAMFNLQGQRISVPQKGINIIGGKKVWVK